MSIGTSTIYDIILPGAHNAGMSFPSNTNPRTSPSIQDSYANTLNSLPTIDAQKQWAQRQTGSITQLLNSGVRFLDLQFLHDNRTDSFYAYNGLLGRTITDIITDITDFLTNTGTEELILIYLHDFLYSQSIAYLDAQWSALLDTFATDTFISTVLSDSNTNDIRSRTMNELIHTDGVQIIIFTDRYPTTSYSNDHYFYDANTYLFLPTDAQGASNATTTFVQGQLDSVSDVRSFVISNLRYGWPDDRLNVIYWTLDIGSSFTEQHVYTSMMDFSSRLNNELNNVLNTYDKLWFANVIIVDFFEISDVMEQLLLLNHDYAGCRDSIWGNNVTGCPALTDLNSKYSVSGTSPMCEINTALQTDCERSCGVCPSTTGGNPGDSCTSNADCNGVLYGYYADSVGECFSRPNTTRARDNIHLESFCLTVDAQTSCANKEISDKCGNETASDISSCDQYCSADWQCQDGYCNPEYSVCMTLLESSTTTEPPVSGSDQRYDFLISEGAEQMLSDVAMFRPGDYQAAPGVDGMANVQCDSPGPDCLMSAMDANPYLASLVGFAIIPFFMALTLCLCYSACCCPCWCCCDKCAKKCCCCHLCMRNPRKDPEFAWRQYPPLVLIVISLIIVIWACIEGIVNNGEMHDHLFGERNSVAFAINNLFDEVIGRFEAVEPTAGYIIDSGVDIMNDIFGILEGSTDSVGATLDRLYAKLDTVAAKYENGSSISAEFVNPFGSMNGSNFSTDRGPFVLPCDYCSTISDQAREMKSIINGSLGQAIGSVDSLMNQTRQLVDAKDMIKNLTSQLFDTLNEVINTANELQDQSNEYIDMGKEYDQTYREQPAQIFFIIPMGLVLFVILGVVMKNKWCFKLEWFCAMYCCGIPIMLLSWPFIFIAVLWGDICVRLDDFEQNLQHSQVGELAGLDDPSITPNDPRAQGLALVNTCWHGGSPLDMFNLTQNLDWDFLQEQMDEVLDVDLTSMLDSADIASFQTGIDTLSIGEFEGKVHSFIAHANSLGEYCGCGERGSPFTWNNLYNPPLFDYCARYVPPNKTLPMIPTGLPGSLGHLADTRTFYWFNTTSLDEGECELAFINASAAVQIYTVATDEASYKIAELKGLFGDAVFDTYDDLFRIASDLEVDISKISCLIEPLLEQFGVIAHNFTNCGFLGEAYGNFKEAGCVNLFDDFYKIARAMAVIAYISIMIVLMALCMDYVYGPIEKEEEYDGDKLYVDGDDDMEPVGHNNAASTVEFQPGGLVGVASFSPDNSQPGSMHYEAQPPPTVYMVPETANYNNAPVPAMALSVQSYSGPVISPMQLSQPTVVPQSGQSFVPVSLIGAAPVASYGYAPQPEAAESEAPSYMVHYDNEPDLPDDPNLPAGEGGGLPTE
eukprot:205214_1